MAGFLNLRTALKTVIVCFAIAEVSLTAASIDPQVRQEIDDFIRKTYLAANNDPAVAIAITNGNGSLQYSAGYGLMDVGNQLPTTNQTSFLIGSISKSFAAAIVCKTLHEKFPELGSAALDTPIRKLIPEFNFTLNDRYRSESTTFRDMLSHRVCAKTDGMATLMVPFKNADEVAYRQRYAPEQCNFRTGFVYNNGMYTLISAAIADAAGRSYESLLLELLNDVEMFNTTIVRASDDDYIPNRAIAYYWRNGEKHNYNPKLTKRVAMATAAGGIVSNAIDMSKYLQFHLNKGRVKDRQIIPENVMEWVYEVAIHFPVTEMNLKPYKADVNIGYALGLQQGIVEGWQRIEHGGSVPPFQTGMSFYPAKDIGIFTATNQMPVNLTLGHSHLHRAIFDILRGADPSIAMSNGKDCHKEKGEERGDAVVKIVKVPAEDLDKYIGSYGNGLQGEVQIVLKRRNDTDELYMDYGQWGQAYLLGTETESKFLADWDSDVVQDKFASDVSDKETFVIFNQNITELQIVDNLLSTDKFIKGVSLDLLPPIPWTNGSCGPEAL